MEEAKFYGSATVGARGQVAIPAGLRRELGLSAGDQVLFIRASEEASGFRVCLPQFALRGQLPDAQTADRARPSPAPAPASTLKAEQMAPRLAAVQSMDLFRDLGAEQQQNVAPLLRPQSYEKGQTIVAEGEPCEALYAVRSGLVKRFKLSGDGREQVLKMLGPGDSFNEVPVLDGGPNPAWSEAVEDTECFVLRREDFLRLLDGSPAVGRGLLQVLSRRLRHLVGLVEDLSFRQVTERVARLLLDQPGVAGRLSQQEIAALVGSVREVVGRALRHLEDAGAIRVEGGKVSVRDERLLRQFAAQP